MDGRSHTLLGGSCGRELDALTTCPSPACPQAADVGNSAATPLGLGKEALKFGEEIASGATSTVHRGTAEGRPAALKRLRISSRDDLERFRKEVAFLAELAHPRIVGILGARALPPDYVVALALHDGTLADALHRRGNAAQRRPTHGQSDAVRSRPPSQLRLTSRTVVKHCLAAMLHSPAGFTNTL